MIHYYAPGGGLGHLTRGRRVLDVLGIDATFVTSSPYAEDPRVTGGRPAIAIPTESPREWLRTLATDRLIVDTFPCGLQGELCGLDVKMDLVARAVKWDEYRRAVPGPLPRFENVWRVEPLPPDQEAAIGATAIPLLLPTNDKPQTTSTPYWLLAHSGPAEEVRELVAYAAELRRIAQSEERVLVATRCAVDLPEHFEHIDAYPVAPLFANATRIISAAGCNVMQETEPWRDKHHVVPFARRFDDQFARAARRRLTAR